MITPTSIRIKIENRREMQEMLDDAVDIDENEDEEYEPENPGDEPPPPRELKDQESRLDRAVRRRNWSNSNTELVDEQTELVIAITKNCKQGKKLPHQGKPRGRIANSARTTEHLVRKVRTKRGRDMYR